MDGVRIIFRRRVYRPLAWLIPSLKNGYDLFASITLGRLLMRVNHAARLA